MGLQRDRRRSFRIAVPGDLLLWRGGRFSGDYKLADISLGGCRLEDGPPPAFGQRFDASLRIDGAEPIELQAVVVRRERGGPAALRFERVDPSVEDEIHDNLVSQLERRGDRAGSVLLVHPRPERVTAVVRMLAGLGHEVRVVSTPLDAVWMLEQAAGSVHTAVVSRGLRALDSEELLAFLASTYPRIRRVLLVPAGSPPGELADRAHAVLEGPPDLGRLRKALPERRAPNLRAVS